MKIRLLHGLEALKGQNIESYHNSFCFYVFTLAALRFSIDGFLNIMAVYTREVSAKVVIAGC
jgi:hypothetical protein